MLKVSATTFAIDARPGSTGRSQLNAAVSHIFTPLKSSVFLIENDGILSVLLTSHFMTHNWRFSNLARARVAAALEIPTSQVVCFSSHNHCTVKINQTQYTFGYPDGEKVLPESDLTAEGLEIVERSVEAAVRLRREMVPVTVHYGRGSENRITHNRKGRRADGSTHLMREEDRLLLGEDFAGDIDTDAFVLSFNDADNRPVAMLAQFTGHPVTAYHCDHPVVHGEYPQIACDDLSAAFGGIPVGFLQGCAGETNSKGLLAATPAEVNAKRATRYGHMLGETYISIAHNLLRSEREDVRFNWTTVTLPLAEVPNEAELRARLEETEAFMARCDAGDDEGTRCCWGLNCPSNMTLPYRKNLIASPNRWLRWALSFHEKKNHHRAPTRLELPLYTLRIGDVGIVGMPCEPFMGIGRQIKAASPTKLTLPCGYMNDTSIAYIPDAPNNGDLDYGSAFYRYTPTLMPYRQPAGDLLASAAIETLGQTLSAADQPQQTEWTTRFRIV